MVWQLDFDAKFNRCWGNTHSDIAVNTFPATLSTIPAYASVSHPSLFSHWPRPFKHEGIWACYRTPRSSSAGARPRRRQARRERSQKTAFMRPSFLTTDIPPVQPSGKHPSNTTPYSSTYTGNWRQTDEDIIHDEQTNIVMWRP